MSDNNKDVELKEVTKTVEFEDALPDVIHSNISHTVEEVASVDSHEFDNYESEVYKQHIWERYCLHGTVAT